MFEEMYWVAKNDAVVAEGLSRNAAYDLLECGEIDELFGYFVDETGYWASEIADSSGRREVNRAGM